MTAYRRDPLYAIENTTSTGRARVSVAESLKNQGPLWTAPEHTLAALMPEALGDVTTSGGVIKKEIFVTQVHYLVLPGALFEDEVTRGGVHFALTASRMVDFIHDVRAEGLDMSPIKGKASVAIPIAAE